MPAAHGRGSLLPAGGGGAVQPHALLRAALSKGALHRRKPYADRDLGSFHGAEVADLRSAELCCRSSCVAAQPQRKDHALRRSPSQAFRPKSCSLCALPGSFLSGEPSCGGAVVRFFSPYEERCRGEGALPGHALRFAWDSSGDLVGSFAAEAGDDPADIGRRAGKECLFLCKGRSEAPQGQGRRPAEGCGGISAAGCPSGNSSVGGGKDCGCTGSCR